MGQICMKNCYQQDGNDEEVRITGHFRSQIAGIIGPDMSLCSLIESYCRILSL
jgi:hypothetical protein